jgi:hypothetical protein
MKLNQRTWKLIDKIDEKAQPNRKDRRFLAKAEELLQRQEKGA